jgi:hypothetical protein
MRVPVRPTFSLAVLILSLAPAAAAENLNVDLGTHWGTPSGSFGAASGQSGTWNQVGLAGSAGLLDVTGAATPVAMSVSALADTGWTGTGSDDSRLLVEDNIWIGGGGSWSVTLSGLANGAYDLYLYAPAHPTVSSGELSIGAVWHGDIPGTWSGSFVEGTNTLRVSLLVTDGQIVIASSFATTLGLAGLQLVEVAYEAGFNVDLGTHWGTPADGFAAASGQAGSWNEVGLAGSAGLTDIIGRGTAVSASVTAQTDTGWSGTGSDDAEVLVQDNIFSSGGSSWTVAFSGLPDDLYDVYLYAPEHVSVPSGALTVNGQAAGSLSGFFAGTFIERINFVRVPVTVGAGGLTLIGSDPSIGGLAAVQIVPVRPAPTLNVDLGVHFGVPDDSFGAAGAAGHWERLGLGSHEGLRDVNGALTATSITVTAGADTGWSSSGTTNAERLFDDDIWSSGTTPWSADISGLPPGWYEVKLYAPAHPSIPSGPLSVNGTALGEIPGDENAALIEGTSWTSVVVEAPQGRIEIGGGGVSSSGLAGLQLAPKKAPAFVSPVPALGPVGVGGLVLAVAVLGALRARRLDLK